jgi:hypothetical protein
MKRRAVFFIAVLALSGMPIVCCLADNHASDPLPQSDNVAVQRGESPRVTKDEIDRAYMNCQMEVDRNTGELVGKVDRRALVAEVKSQRAFCDNRKHDCARNSQSPECRTFVDEFKVSDFVASALKEGKGSP